MAYKNPPKETRFPVNRPDKPHTQKHPNGYLVPKLKRFLKKQIQYEDPETRKMVTGETGDALMWRLLLSGCQGEIQAIKEIFERTDGKVSQALKGEGFGDNKIIFIVKDGHSKKRDNNSVALHTPSESAND